MPPKKRAGKKGKGKRKPAPKKNGAKSPGGAKDASSGPKKDAMLEALSATGVLATHPLSRDIKIDSFNLSLHGTRLIADSRIEINCGKRYGLLGLNGSGKSAFLKCLGAREVPIPDFMDIYLLENEVPASEKTPLEVVMEQLNQKIARLEKEAEDLAMEEDTLAADRLEEIYDQLDTLNPDTAETRAARILSGLGFTPSMQNKKAKDFSGGWRMRIALAKALFIEPMMLLLDEPTNHLDLEACVWLEEYLKGYGRILFLVSHSQDFLNGVCTNVIHLHNKKLNYYTGNFDSYVKTRTENEVNQMKRYKWEQDQIAEIKDFVRRFGHGSKKLARQAQSREKLLAKMEADGLTEPVVQDRLVSFDFFDCGKLPLPVMQFQDVSFKYDGTDEYIYKDIDFGIDQTTRLALVGPNGAGKSTLLKLMTGALEASEGMIRRHNKLELGWYRQHLMEELDPTISPLDYMLKVFPGCKEVQEMRAALGKFGLTGKHQTSPMYTLSDGLKSRVVFAQLAYDEPHILLLDEPTNHLDIETIDALAGAINRWNGGMVLVSHDFRLINQVAKDIWICENQTLSRWEGSIMEYKDTLRKNAEEYL